MANQSEDRALGKSTANVKQSPASGDTEMTTIVEPSPLLAHLCRTFTTRELVQLTTVSKRLQEAIPDNSLIIAQVRWEDDYNDVYFPLLLSQSSSEGERSLRRSWNWVGFHHPTGETHVLPSLAHLSAKVVISGGLGSSDGRIGHANRTDRSGAQSNVTTLPSTHDNLSADGRIDFDSTFRSLLAISGGLLLFSLTRSDQQPLHGAWNWKHSVHERRWRALLVSNPLTKTWRELPAPHGTSWDYDGARAHLVVMDEETSTYKVLLLFRDRICVYTSTTRGWNVRLFQERIPWGQGLYHGERVGGGSTEYVDVAWAIVGGKLFYAELEDADPHDNGTVKVFEVDEEGGTWKPAIQYALRNFFPPDLHEDSYDLGFGFGSCGIGLVECMGGMYVVIPAYLDDTLDVSDNIRNMYNLGERMIDGEDTDGEDTGGEETDGEETDGVEYGHFRFFPIRFYVLQLNGVGLRFGQVLLRRPHSMEDEEFKERSESVHWSRPSHKKHLRVYLDDSPDSEWYACKGEGSVIIIAFDDYLLEYDIFSGVTTTKILLDRSFAYQQDNPYTTSSSTLSYRPSFHMKP